MQQAYHWSHLYFPPELGIFMVGLFLGILINTWLNKVRKP